MRNPIVIALQPYEQNLLRFHIFHSSIFIVPRAPLQNAAPMLLCCPDHIHEVVRQANESLSRSAVMQWSPQEELPHQPLHLYLAVQMVSARWSKHLLSKRDLIHIAMACFPWVEEGKS
jgi:hypothetical protein